MKPTFNRFLHISAAAFGMLSSSAWALETNKADNINLLDLGTSWAGGSAPTSSDVATWSGAYTTAGSLSSAFTASTPVSWQGIKIGAISGTAAGLVSIGGTGNAITGSSISIGTSGIDMSTAAGANQNLVINSATTVLTGASQTWNVATGRNLRFGITGTGSANANLDGTAGTVVTIQGGGVVDANQGGASGFADAAGFAGFNGKWVVSSGTTLRGIRNGATAWGTNTAADAITLSGGTLAVGGISGTQGNWTWQTPITLTASTDSSIDQQLFSGAGRSLILRGAMTGSGNLTFKETGTNDAFSNNDLGYIIATDNPSLSGTITIGGATENGISGRLSSVRVGGDGTAGSVATGVGSTGTLGTATIVNNGVLTLSRNNTWTFANNMSGTGLLRIGVTTGEANHIVTVSGNNTHSGGTTLQSAVTLKIGSSNALGSGTFTIAGSGIFDNATGSALTVANALTMSGGSPTFVGTNDMTINGAVTISGANRTITTNAGTLTLGGNIGQDVAGRGLTKQGVGKLVISGTNNTYSGATNVNLGTLVVNGNISTSSLTTINNGATLAGTGITGALTNASGGTLAPGDGGIETIDVSGALTLAAGSISNFEINTAGDAADLAIASALLTFGGTLNVSNIGGALVNGDIFNLFDWGTTSGAFSAVNLPILTGGLTWDQSSLYTNGTIAVVPEPAAALFGGIGMLILLRRRRRV